MINNIVLTPKRRQDRDHVTGVEPVIAGQGMILCSMPHTAPGVGSNLLELPLIVDRINQAVKLPDSFRKQISRAGIFCPDLYNKTAPIVCLLFFSQMR